MFTEQERCDIICALELAGDYYKAEADNFRQRVGGETQAAFYDEEASRVEALLQKLS